MVACFHLNPAWKFKAGILVKTITDSFFCFPGAFSLSPFVTTLVWKEKKGALWCHSMQYVDILYDDTQHINTHSIEASLICLWYSHYAKSCYSDGHYVEYRYLVFQYAHCRYDECLYAECCCTKCHCAQFVKPSVITLIVGMLSVIMPSAIILSVAAPKFLLVNCNQVRKTKKNVKERGKFYFSI
jgi:hypothetical protein